MSEISHNQPQETPLRERSIITEYIWILGNVLLLNGSKGANISRSNKLGCNANYKKEEESSLAGRRQRRPMSNCLVA